MIEKNAPTGCVRSSGGSATQPLGGFPPHAVLLVLQWDDDVRQQLGLFRLHRIVQVELVGW